MNKLIEIKEFDFLVCNKDVAKVDGYTYLDQDTFAELENLILTYNEGNKADAKDFIDISTRRNVGKVICAKNYVGLIQTKNGSMIQILPKIDFCDDIDTKKIFLKMLDAPSRPSHPRWRRRLS